MNNFKNDRPIRLFLIDDDPGILEETAQSLISNLENTNRRIDIVTANHGLAAQKILEKNSEFDSKCCCIISPAKPWTICISSGSRDFAEDITCSSKGLSAKGCNTFGKAEFILVPFPAAKIIILNMRLPFAHDDKTLNKV